MKMRIDPAQLGAVPCRDIPDCWVLTDGDQQRMTIACASVEEEIFTVTIPIATLLPNAQAYQLAAALMLNRDAKNLNGGAVAYDVHDDSFFYCKEIDARTLTLSAFSRQARAGFAAARLLGGMLRYAQADIAPARPPAPRLVLLRPRDSPP
ncbi:type III secretion system chaperone [Duganella radicis]|uniref:Uncharacterized protein n=1 Tax=Duganella radicis TaxID=551988 RepID=A0A6L6PRL0_9BURK|nr:type III secretion system chaperone [Duganella radicis]MTV41733.1 hypothetical protein [Duganella radicis]